MIPAGAMHKKYRREGGELGFKEWLAEKQATGELEYHNEKTFSADGATTMRHYSPAIVAVSIVLAVGIVWSLKKAMA